MVKEIVTDSFKLCQLQKQEAREKNNWLNLSLRYALFTNPYVNELEIKEEKTNKKKTKQNRSQFMIHKRPNNRHIPFRYYEPLIAMPTLSLLLLSARLPMTPDPKPILCIKKKKKSMTESVHCV